MPDDERRGKDDGEQRGCAAASPLSIVIFEGPRTGCIVIQRRHAGRTATVALAGAASLFAIPLSAVPLPPPRPATITPANPPPSSPAPPSSGFDPDTVVLDPDHPPVLPTASRAKMSQCGREWQAMKRSGADRDMTWRQFATSCLVR
jgi:hypothetical protein